VDALVAHEQRTRLGLLEHGVRATDDPRGLARDAASGVRWPLLASCPVALRWLRLQADLGRSPRTIDAYARSLVDYLGYCERRGLDVAAVGRGEIAGYVRELRERPSRRRANVIAIDSGAGLANATLQLRVTVVRLFYDFLVEERVCDRNPVIRGRRGAAAGSRGERGLLPRYSRLPWIPTDEQWRQLLTVAAGEPLRNRLRWLMTPV
jgi:integrase/recombinase XerD